MTALRQRFVAARFLAVRSVPYFARALLAVRPVEVPDGTFGAPGGTMGITDEGLLMYEPQALQRWTLEQAAAVLVHEVSHWLREHRQRRGNRNPMLWNYAGDAEINDDLQAMRLSLPDSPVLPASFNAPNGQPAEIYYDLLVQHVQHAAACCGSGAGNAVKNEPRAGGGQGGEGQGDDQTAGQVAAPVGLSPSDAAEIRELVAREVVKAQGSAPAGLRRWASQKLKPPKIDWRAKLRRSVRIAVAWRAGAGSTWYGRPSRKQAGIGFGVGKPVLPSHRDTVPNVAVVVDTSGSMSGKDLDDALGEAAGVLKAAGADVVFCACDAKVHSLEVVSSPKEFHKLLKGGGGTDFRPAFDALLQLKRPPDVIVFITDGYGTAPQIAPRAKTIWVLVGKSHTRPAPWGDCVVVTA